MGSACGPHGPYVPDVLFWCVVLFFSTVFMSAFLKDFKFSSYFPTKVGLRPQRNEALWWPAPLLHSGPINTHWMMIFIVLLSVL